MKIERKRMYGELSQLLTNYENGEKITKKDFYEFLVKIQNSWEDIITSENGL